MDLLTAHLGFTLSLMSLCWNWWTRLSLQLNTSDLYCKDSENHASTLQKTDTWNKQYLQHKLETTCNIILIIYCLKMLMDIVSLFEDSLCSIVQPAALCRDPETNSLMWPDSLQTWSATYWLLIRKACRENWVAQIQSLKYISIHQM